MTQAVSNILCVNVRYVVWPHNPASLSIGAPGASYQGCDLGVRLDVQLLALNAPSRRGDSSGDELHANEEDLFETHTQ